MKQREIERVSGWVAFCCWVLFFCLMAIFAATAQHPPRRYQPFDAGAAMSDAVGGLLGKKTHPHPLVETPEYINWSNQMTLLLASLAIAGFASFTATGWWNWRRRQRIRVEIRAEAYDGRRRASRLRDGRAAGV